MGIIDDFLSYYESSVRCYTWYRSMSHQAILPKRTVTGEVSTSFPDHFSLEKTMSEINLKAGLHEEPIEQNDSDRVFPLDSELKNQFELVYAVDFAEVMIHLGAMADQMARDHGASAVTQGSDIYFRSDQYAPHTQEGQKLLAHELQHVQQFQSGQAMNADEDINQLEEKASGAENILSEVNLHSLTKPVLSQDSQTGSDELEMNLQDSLAGSGSQSDVARSDESLDSFGNKVHQINYRVYLDSGKHYDFTPPEYDELLERLAEKMAEHLDAQKYLLKEEDYIDFIQKVSAMMKWSMI